MMSPPKIRIRRATSAKNLTILQWQRNEQRLDGAELRRDGLERRLDGRAVGHVAYIAVRRVQPLGARGDRLVAARDQASIEA